MDLKSYVRDIPDFPEPGIVFKDITPLLQDPDAFSEVIGTLADRYGAMDIDSIVGIDARGFLFAAPLAYKLGKPLVPVRKEGKLPFDTRAATYELEYGKATVELHTDGVEHRQRVVIVDDLLATGGTLGAAAKLVEDSGGHVAELAVVIELSFLNGRERLAGREVYSMVEY